MKRFLNISHVYFGTILRLYQSSFMTMKNLSCILEPPSVSYFNLYKVAVNISVKRDFNLSKLRKKAKKNDFSAASPRDTEKCQKY